MMLVTGAIFLVLGLASGAILVAAPFGIGPAQPGPITWVLFPALTIVGWLMVVFAARNSAVPLISRTAGAALIALAVAAVVGLFLAGNALVQPTATTLPLWYVVAVGFVFGIGGIAIRRGDTG